MGESQLEEVESDELSYVPYLAFEELREAGLAAEQCAALFAAYARINVFYSIARAWSGHIGTCFSSVDIMTWLFLERMQGLDQGQDKCDLFFSSKAMMHQHSIPCGPVWGYSTSISCTTCVVLKDWQVTRM